MIRFRNKTKKKHVLFETCMFQVVFGSDFFGFWSRMAVDHSLSLSSWANHISSIGLPQPCQKKKRSKSVERRKSEIQTFCKLSCWSSWVQWCNTIEKRHTSKLSAGSPSSLGPETSFNILQSETGAFGSSKKKVGGIICWSQSKYRQPWSNIQKCGCQGDVCASANYRWKKIRISKEYFSAYL